MRCCNTMLDTLFGPGRNELFHLSEIQNLRNKLFNAMVDNKPITLSGHRDSQCESDTSIQFKIKPRRIDCELIDALNHHPSLTIRCKLVDGTTFAEEDCVLFLVKSNHAYCARNPNIKFLYYLVNKDDPCLNYSPQDLSHLDLMQANP